MKVAVVGAGKWGQNLVKTLHQLGALGAVVDSDPARASAMRSLYPEVAQAGSLEEASDLGLTAVAIATPVPTHFAIAKRAIELGLDVFVEKPITVSRREAEELELLARQHNRILMVGHLLLYQSAIRWIASYLKEGGIGRVLQIHQERLNLGRVRAVENVLWSFGVHDIAVLLNLVGETPSEVTAKGIPSLNPSIEDDVHLHLKFPSGIQSTLHVSWLWPEKVRRLTLIGDNGTLVFDETTGEVVLHKKRVDAQLNAIDEGSEVVFKGAGEPLRAELEHFLGCLVRRESPLSDGRNGVEVMGVLEAAGDSMARAKGSTGPTAAPVFQCHPTSFVDPGACVGEGTRIWHFSHLSSGAKVGRHCSLGQNVFVAKNVKVGDFVKIQNNVSLYEGVEIDDYAFCGPSMVFTNVRTPRSAFPRNTSSDYVVTRVGRGASIGANATIVCGTQIGAWSFVAAGAVVTRDTVPYSLMAGVPARRLGWACACGLTLKIKGTESRCEECGREYRLKTNDELVRTDALTP